MKNQLIFLLVITFIIYSDNRTILFISVPEPFIAPIKNNKQDRPDLSIELENEMTKDPKLDRPVPERLLKIRHDIKKGRYDQNLYRTNENEWVERGPDNIGGRTRAILVDSNDPTGNKVWAGGVSGGLWYTTNFKSPDAYWTAVDDFLPTLAISSLAQDPTDPQVLYFGTGEGYFNGDAVRGLGIWKSEDGGSNWNQINSTNDSPFFYIQRIKLNDQGHLFVCTRSFGVLKSENGGSTWQKVLGNGTGGAFSDRACDLEITSDGVIFASMGIQSSDGIYRSMDGGSTWTGLNGSTLNNGLPFENYERIELAFSHSNPLFGYALFQDPDENTCNGIYRTTDGGDNWESMTIPGAFGLDVFTRNQAWYDLNVAVDPFNEYIVYIGGIDILRSVDGGETWTQLSQWYGSGGFQFVHADQHEMLFHNLNPLSGIVSNDGGVFSFEIDPLISGNGEPEYCNPVHFDCCSDFIAKVELNNISNSSGAGNSALINGYSDFTSISTDLELNEVYTIAATPNYTWDDSKMGIWADWNQDGEFSDDENILSTSGQGPYMADFSVPADAAHGPTRIRIRLQFSPDYVPHPCDGAYTMGETEDYTVVVNNCIVGNKCNDGDVCTENEILDEDCNCIGTPVDINQDGICDIINKPVFQAKNNGYNITQFYSCDIDPTSGSNNIIAGSQDNGTQYFTSEGINSTVAVNGGDGGYCFIDQDEPQIQIATYLYNNYTITNDGWESVQEYLEIGDDKGRFINPMDYDSETNTIIASYDDGFIARVRKIGSENIPDTIQIDELAGLKVSAVKNIPNEGKMWIGTSKNYSDQDLENVIKLILISGIDNEEIVVEKVLEFGDGNFQGTAFLRNIDIHPENPSTMTICFSNYGVPSIWQTTDEGKSWVNIEGNFPDMPVRWFMYDPVISSGALIATEMGVWKTDQIQGSMTIWSPMNENLAHVKTNMLKFRKSDNTLVVATYGRGIFTMNYCTTEIELDETICEGESYELGGMTFSESGSFQVTVEDEGSCLGSIEFFLNLTVGDIPMISLGDTIFLNLGESTTLTPGTGFSSYIWSTGSNEESIEIVADEIGAGETEIIVEVQNIFGCTAISKVIVVVMEPSSTEEFETRKINVYPNPGSEYIFLEFDGEVKFEQYQIYGFNGRLLKSALIRNNQLQRIDISFLPKGQYFISVFGSNDVVTQKFMKL